jgi:hypothetical protein
MVAGAGGESDFARLVANGCDAAGVVGDAVDEPVWDAAGDPLGSRLISHLKWLVSLVVRGMGVTYTR